MTYSELEKKLERNGRYLIEVLSWHLSGVTEAIFEKISVDIPADIRTQHRQNTSLEYYL